MTNRTPFEFVPAFVPSSRPRAGFTLIEVLIGVIVLGLGLLGLASVFPAVVVQQKQAADAVQGDSTAKSVESFMRASPKLSEPYVGGLDRMRIDERFSDPADLCLWETGTGNDESTLLDFNDGTLFINQVAENNTVAEIERLFPAIERAMDATGVLSINQAMRLYPAPKFRGIAQQNPPPTAAELTLRQKGDGPQFVWDVAFRRDRVIVPPRSDEHVGRASDGVQVAMFIRRLDPGIRGDLDTVFNPVGNARTFAVAESDAGVPTLDGRGRYSPIRRVELQVATAPAGTAEDRRRVVVAGASEDGVDAEVVEEWLGRAGQKVVGPQGQVWTVALAREEETANGERIVLTLDRALSDLSQPTGNTAQVLFTMQTPAAVRVFTIDAPQRPVFADRN